MSSEIASFEEDSRNNSVVSLATTTTFVKDGKHADLQSSCSTISIDIDVQKPIRLITKDGRYKVKLIDKENHRIKLLRNNFRSDAFWTVVDLKWRYTFLLFFLAFAISWLSFAIIYYVIAFIGEDLQFQHGDPEAVCVQSASTFVGLLLFSFETQQTIGYGFRHITEHCAAAIITANLQSIVGLLINAFVVAVMIAKLAQPRKRGKTIFFSENAVICYRQHQLMLMFRFCDMRNSHLINTKVRLFMVERFESIEGEINLYNQRELPLQIDGLCAGSGSALLSWPMVACHVIDEKSPFFDVSEASLANAEFELIATLQGVSESSGMVVQARTSFLPNEILWGHRFGNFTASPNNKNIIYVNFTQFNKTKPYKPMPSLSAKELLRNGLVQEQ